MAKYRCDRCKKESDKYDDFFKADPYILCKDCFKEFKKWVHQENQIDDMCSNLTGRWIIHFDDLFPEESTQECSLCHAEQYLRYGDDDNYCPNCGAHKIWYNEEPRKMDIEIWQVNQ